MTLKIKRSLTFLLFVSIYSNFLTDTIPINLPRILRLFKVHCINHTRLIETWHERNESTFMPVELSITFLLIAFSCHTHPWENFERSLKY